MSVMSKSALNEALGTIRYNNAVQRALIQEALISCAFYAMKDANVTPFNQLLEACGTGETRIKGITMWAETFAPVYIKDGKFAYSKKAGSTIAVTSEEDFVRYEADMRKGPSWAEIAPKEKAVSIWDCAEYLEGVVKRLQKHGVDSDVIAAVEQVELMVRIRTTKATEEGAIVPTEEKLAA